MIFAFEIPDLPKMPNSLLRKHWSVIMKERKKWHGLVGLCCIKYQGETLQRAKLKLTRYSTRQPDFDGLAGSFKFVQDSLVKSKVIIDDKPSVIDVTYAWEKCKLDQQRIRVEIWPWR